MVLKDYHRVITHLRQKNEDHNLILCLGAGINFHWKLPNWQQLVRKISSNPEVNGESIYKMDISLSSKAQLLFEHFHEKYKSNSLKQDDLYFDDVVRRAWIEIVHKELYSDVDLSKDHPYISEFLDIIKNAPVTINYNFDDIIEQCIFKTRENANERGYETVWNPSLRYKIKKGVIYHPNGFLPQSLSDGYSDHFIFTENSFQDQLIDSMFGHYNSLLYLFSRYTVLFIGLSLEDQTLRHLLHQNSVINPGHFHYYVYYSSKRMSETEKKAVRDAYFKTFNLIVLFLNDNGIKEVGKLINMDALSFKDRSLRTLDKVPVYNYYISGAPGTGKTTGLEYLSSFTIYNEWPDQKNPLIDKSDDKLTEDERIEVDSWINEQFRKKNQQISDPNKKSCIQLIDRSPLDPITYANPGETRERAKKLLKTFNKVKHDTKLAPGQIILLEAKADVIFRRLQKRTPGAYDEAWVEKKLSQFKKLFNDDDVIKIDTTNLSVVEMVKKIAYKVYYGKYKEVNLMRYLNAYCNGRDIHTA